MTAIHGSPSMREELMTSDSDIRWWLLDRHPDETHLWNHPQSNGDQFFPVATVLLGIASCYVDRRRHELERWDGAR